MNLAPHTPKYIDEYGWSHTLFFLGTLGLVFLIALLGSMLLPVLCMGYYCYWDHRNNPVSVDEYFLNMWRKRDDRKRRFGREDETSLGAL